MVEATSCYWLVEEVQLDFNKESNFNFDPMVW